ncbi:hypothetical protein, partial [Helicobacter sp. 11S02629-2]|uniref:hypothetical protein n=1 Tax=Helicobacter sp. 11S02629-2 TaxID=1476195 RepID=UPI0015DA03EE
LDFIQAFKIGSGYVKLGYILGAGVAIRTHDSGSNRSGSFSGDNVAGAALAVCAQNDQSCLDDPEMQKLQKKVNDEYGAKLAKGNAATQISTIQSQFPVTLTSANSTLASAMNDILLNNFNSAQTKISQVNSTIKDLQNSINNYKSALGTLGQDSTRDNTLSGLISSQASLNTSLQTVQTALASAIKLNELKTSTAGDSSQTNSTIASLTDNLNKANKSIADQLGTIAAQGSKISSLQTQLKEILDQARVAASQSAAELEAERKRREASAKNVPTILPTLKAGLIAFIGKHQAVSLEYQYYFRTDANKGVASSDISLNYTYYFGGK